MIDTVNMELEIYLSESPLPVNILATVRMKYCLSLLIKNGMKVVFVVLWYFPVHTLMQALQLHQTKEYANAQIDMIRFYIVNAFFVGRLQVHFVVFDS